MRIGAITIVAGRYSHLQAQQLSMSLGTLVPEILVVVSMGDPGVTAVVAEGPFGSDGSGTVVHVEHVEVPANGSLPLSAARNVGAARAMAEGTELLVFLDVDCLVHPSLMSSYAAAAESLSRSGRPALLSGPVAYLPTLTAGRSTYSCAVLAAARPHPARPAPPPGRVERAEDPRLFWSLSFALTDASWSRIGGFDEGYAGYGGEDTDFAQRAANVEAEFWWVGGALAYHQWHPVSDPPVEHLAAIVANANLFKTRWGWFPMEGWLGAFEKRSLACYDAGADRWTVN